MQRYEALTDATGLEIAIVGMSGRFPDAPDVDALWRNIRDGVESVSEFGDAELDAAGVPPTVRRDPGFVNAGVRFAGADLFDAAFFGYAPREAESLDPQQRIFLECAWQALEHAGYDASRIAVPVGVYAGCGANLYLMRHLLPRCELGAGAGIAELIGLMNGNANDALSTRVAYKLNLRGPAVTVQTACSTSLVAVHMACEALLSEACDMALAGGVWLNLLQDAGYRHQAGAILSSDGHCRAFDAKADGTVLGSGAGIVVLKRLAQALDDGDTIHAVIRATAINNDGADKIGYTAPSVTGQAAVIGMAQMLADVSPDSIGYVEAHGTGTTLGDPIEIAALTQAFRVGTERRQFCAVGSVKTNIGHLDAAAGVAGLIKTVQALRHRTLPPSLHFAYPNPRIDFAGSPFYVNTQTSPWPAGQTPRRAGVSSFGMGGTNAHAVLEEAPRQRAVSHSASAQLLLVSARSEQAVVQAVDALDEHLHHAPDLALDDVAHTLATGRRRFAHRVAVVASDSAQAVQTLRARALPDYVSGTVLSDAPSVAFLFPGQGAQHVAMARTLYEREPIFRETVDRCCEALRVPLGDDLRMWLYPNADGVDEAAAQLARTAWTQPALFVIEYALATLWMSWGVRPDAMIGHSIGEYVAACIAGVFSLDDALTLVVARGKLMQSSAPGAMLAVSLPESALASYLACGCDLAAVNAASLCVLSGTPGAIAQAEQQLTAEGVAVRALHVSHAFHSALLEPVVAQFEALVSRMTLHAPTLPFVSNVTGRWITQAQACSPQYWAQHLRGTVRFAAGLDTLLEKADRIPLEVGPGETLASLAKRHPKLGKRPVLHTHVHPKRAAQQAEQPLRCLAQLWVAGVDIDAALATRALPGRQRVPLPTYPFERQSYWVPLADTATAAATLANVTNATGSRDMDHWFHVPIFRRTAMPAPRAGAGCTLVLGDADSLSDRLLQQLTSDDAARVVSVVPGPAFARIDAHRYVVQPTSVQDLEQVLRAVDAELGTVAHICHLWSAGGNGYASLLALAQALQGAGTPASILVVTDQLADVSGTEALDPERALLLGPTRVIPQELPGVACRLVDIERPASGSDGETRLVEQLRAELYGDGTHALLAYRGPHRWVRGYEPVANAGAGAVRLRQGGVYLITGGLGGIGQALARHLASHWQARLVLVSRQADRVDQADLEAFAGAQILRIAADVTDAESIRAAVARAREHFGALHGVIHAAGVSADGLIAQRSEAVAKRVFAPKIDGTRHLLAALGDAAPDFVLLCSSLASVAGGLGRVDYAAANAYLDAVATAHLRTGRYPVISVNWDGWRDVGMAAGLALPDGVGIAPAQGAQAFERIVNGAPVPQMLVVTTDLDSRLRGLDADLLAAIEVAQLAARARHPRPALRTAFVEPVDDLSIGLADLWGDLLGVDGVGVHDNLFELGGDSLLAIQLLASVRAAWGVDVHPSAFFRLPTIDALGILVESKLIEQIQAQETASAPSV
ncbi:SDR family NAD(P)-dependent oxidoreductase [Pandoraea sp. NPDC087047]|uniref:type I polyketide synthase n=1 Tax=Pandoraea sp. NPDC087047 TaxID=3364390 RepID=UPI0038198C42